VSAAPDSLTAPGAGTVKRPRAHGGSWLRRSAWSLWARWNNAQAFVPPPREQWPVALRRARIVGLSLLGIQLTGLGWWSYVLASRDVLSRDFSTYAQSIYLIVHGHLDPYSTTTGHLFWRDHSAFIMWPLAFVQSIWPHAVTLLWMQDLATVGMEAVAFVWICDIAADLARRRQAMVFPTALIALGIVLLAPDPWMVWASSFDFHIEAFSALCAIATARELFLGRRRAWVWAVLALSTGDLGATYIAAVGAGAALSGRRRLRAGSTIMLLGTAWFLLLSALHGSEGSQPHDYALILTGSNTGTVSGHDTSLNVITAALRYPARALHSLWDNRVDLWANLSPGGVIGLVWLPVLLPLWLMLAESQLTSVVDFSYPGFQSIAVVPLVSVGTVALLGVLYRKASARGLTSASIWVLLIMMAANSVAWAVVWIPHASERWLAVTPRAAAVIRGLQSRIGPRDEVIVSQGIQGAFATREFVYALFGATATEPINAHRVWVILTVDQGIEIAKPSGIYADIDTLTHMSGSRLVVASDGIWAFEWLPQPGTRMLQLNPKLNAAVPGWALPGPSGIPVTDGMSADWHVSSTNQSGYVLDHAYWREEPGSYRIMTTLATSGGANVEVWNTTTSTLLSRQSVPATNGKTTVQTTVSLPESPPEHLFSGWGPWRTDVDEPEGDQLEVRVWSPGGDDQVDVYNVSLQKAG
jgi:hypothetical protein